jgi:hypothetical protein
MSPLEIAKEFEAPLLKPVGSNRGLHRAKALGCAGMQRVQYEEEVNGGDAASDDSDPKRLVMGLLENMKKPSEGEMYGI